MENCPPGQLALLLCFISLLSEAEYLLDKELYSTNYRLFNTGSHSLNSRAKYALVPLSQSHTRATTTLFRINYERF